MQPIGRASAAALANSTDDQAAAAAEESAAGPSSSSNEYSAILGNIEIPEGVDPSFLAALPEEMRQEVIAEHLRLQRVRQRASDDIASSNNSQVMEFNPEFLAALPPNIQEEVLAQTQLERQQVEPRRPSIVPAVVKAAAQTDGQIFVVYSALFEIFNWPVFI